MKHLVFGAALTAVVPSHAFAQAPVYPNVPPPPFNLEPGASAAAPAPVPEPAAPAPQPQVIVVGPDGKLVPQTGKAAGPSGYFVGADVGPMSDDVEPLPPGGATPPLHVVRGGDTLWDLCFLYFNDPWQWPKIWSYNPQITNPHWIYPGDLVRLLPRGMFAAVAQDRAADPEAPAPVDALPAPQRSVEASIRQTAFVEKADLDRSIRLEGSVEEKVMLGQGDAVYLRYVAAQPPKVGERYSVYVPASPVKDNGTEIGSFVRVLGTIEVTNVTQDKRARGVIVESNQEIERGARLGTLQRTFKPVPPVAPKVDVQARIVAMLGGDQLIGDGEVVFINLGRRSGIEIGNSMFVVRRGDAFPENMDDHIGQDDRIYPARRLGRIMIVDVGERVSIGLVTLAVQEMSVGDLVIMQASR